jgi:hypothetical protein
VQIVVSSRLALELTQILGQANASPRAGPGSQLASPEDVRASAAVLSATSGSSSRAIWADTQLSSRICTRAAQLALQEVVREQFHRRRKGMRAAPELCHDGARPPQLCMLAQN